MCMFACWLTCICYDTVHENEHVYVMAVVRLYIQLLLYAQTCTDQTHILQISRPVADFVMLPVAGKVYTLNPKPNILLTN